MRLARRADHPAGLDELLLLQRKHLAAHQAGDRHPTDDGQRGEEQQEAVHKLTEGRLAQRHHHDDEEQQVRKRVNDIREAHQNVIDVLAGKPCRHADNRAENQDDRRRDEADRHRHTRAIDRTAEHVPADAVRPQQEARITALRPRGGEVAEPFVDFQRIMRRELLGEDRHEQEDNDQHQAGHRGLVLGQPVKGIFAEAARGPRDQERVSRRLIWGGFSSCRCRCHTLTSAASTRSIPAGYADQQNRR